MKRSPKIVSLDRSVRFVENGEGCESQTVTVLTIQLGGKIISVPAYPEAYDLIMREVQGGVVNVPSEKVEGVSAIKVSPPQITQGQEQEVQELEEDVEDELEEQDYNDLFGDIEGIPSI